MTRGTTSINVKRTAFGGILLALSAVTLFLATTLPTSRFALYALSSFYVAVFIMEFGIKAGWIFYTASCLLGFIAVRGGISGWVLYILFFGLYSTIKFYIEKINILVFEYILKLVFYNAVLLVAIIFIKSFLLSSIKTSFPWWIIIVASEILFLIYDYIFTLFIQYYRNKLKRFLKI